MKKSDFKDTKQKGELAFEIYYVYNTVRYKTIIFEKSKEEAEHKFFNISHGDWCEISSISLGY